MRERLERRRKQLRQKEQQLQEKLSREMLEKGKSVDYQESCEQETEEDTLSITSIDQEAEEDTLTIMSIDSCMRHLTASSHGVAYNAKKVLPVAEPVQESHHGQERFVKESMLSLPASCHETKEEDSLSTTSTIDYDLNYSDEYSSADEKYPYPETLSFFKYPRSVSGTEWADKDAWVASWKDLCPLPWTWIDVYAYFQKKQRYGGYGVILRDAEAKPIIASAKFSKRGKSFFYQVFMGIKAGVELAEKYQRSCLHVQCNSDKVKALCNDARRCTNKICIDTGNLIICGSCERKFSFYRGYNKSLLPFVVELRGKIIERIIGNESWAGHYLAKREKKNKRPGVEKKVGRISPKGEMKPDDFPQELINILWEDVSATHNYIVSKRIAPTM